MVSNGKIKVMADQGSVSGILQDHAKIKVDMLAATSKEGWLEFGVDDSAGTRVQLFTGEKKILDVMVGNFKFSPQTRRAQSFLRLYDDEKVYGVDGYLSLWYNNTFNGYRNKIIWEGDKGSWDSLSFRYLTDTAFTLYKDTSGRWSIRGFEKDADSSAIDSYLNVVWGIRPQNYIDTNININQYSPQYELTVYSRKNLKWTVKCYIIPVSERDTLWCLTSTYDPSNIWNAKAEDKVLEKIFYPFSHFIKKKEESKPGKK